MNGQITRLRMSDYATYEWIERRHLTSALIAMSEAELAQHGANCERLDSSNLVKWVDAEDERNRALAAYRNQHPYGKPKAYLTTANPRPPNFSHTFSDLMARRAKGIRDQTKQAETKKTTFLERMNEGKANALRRRYQRAEEAVSMLGIALGIQLKAKQLDERLDELYVHLVGKLESEASDE